ncbi:MAG: S-layer homology domain-containing protein, partial [Eubacterium sp.]|nr:S-layer homology domain-containing protein [Eubacterium sp.]
MRSIKKGISILLSSAMMIGTFAAGPVGSLGNVYAEGADSAYEIDADDAIADGIVADDTADDNLGDGEAIDLKDYPEDEIGVLVEGNNSVSVTADNKKECNIPSEIDGEGTITYGQETGRLFKLEIPATTAADLTSTVSGGRFRLFDSLTDLASNFESHYSDISSYQPEQYVLNCEDEPKTLYVWLATWYSNELEAELNVAFESFADLMLPKVAHESATKLVEGKYELSKDGEVKYVEEKTYTDAGVEYTQYSLEYARIYEVSVPAGTTARLTITGFDTIAPGDYSLASIYAYEDIDDPDAGCEWLSTSPAIKYAYSNEGEEAHSIFVTIRTYNTFTADSYEIDVDFITKDEMMLTGFLDKAVALEEGEQKLTGEFFPAFYPNITWGVSESGPVLSDKYGDGILYKYTVPSNTATKFEYASEANSEVILYESFTDVDKVSELGNWNTQRIVVNNSDEEETVYLWFTGVANEADADVTFIITNIDYEEKTFDKMKGNAKVLQVGENTVGLADTVEYFDTRTEINYETGEEQLNLIPNKVILCKYTVPAGQSVVFTASLEDGHVNMMAEEGEFTYSEGFDPDEEYSYSNFMNDPVDIYLAYTPYNWNELSDFTVTVSSFNPADYTVDKLAEESMQELSENTNIIDFSKATRASLASSYGNPGEETREYRLKNAVVAYLDIPKGKVATVTADSENMDEDIYVVTDPQNNYDMWWLDENDCEYIVENINGEDSRRVYFVIVAREVNEELNLNVALEDAEGQLISNYAATATELTEGNNTLKGEGAMTVLVKNIIDWRTQEEGYESEKGKLYKLTVPSLSDTIVKLNFKGSDRGYREFRAFRDLTQVSETSFGYDGACEYYLFDKENAEENVSGDYYFWWTAPEDDEENEVEIEFLSKSALAVNSSMVKSDLVIGRNKVKTHDPDKTMYIAPVKEEVVGWVGQGAVYKYTLKPGETLYADVIPNKKEGENYDSFYVVRIIDNGETIANLTPYTFGRFKYSLADGAAPTTLLFVVVDYGDEGTCEINLQNWPFNDVPTIMTGANEIADAYVTGIVGGISTDAKGQVKYKPSAPVNRAQFAIMLFNMAYTLGHDPYTDDVSGAVEFKDVPQDANYYEAIKWASSQGIISGQTDKEGNPVFKPTNPITRQQMAILLMKFA